MKIRAARGQLSYPLALFMALIGLIIALFSYELCEYLLARQQLQSVVQAAALTCETSLASSGATVAGLSNAFTAGTEIFQLNSILGTSLSGAALLPSGQTMALAAGQSAVSFQLLDPMMHQPLAIPTAGNLSGAVIQATGMYAYLPTFSTFVGIAFLPVQMQATVVSGVQQLDLVVALDISGGMDDDTPVTLVQRYWDYDNNYPPHHIVYMITEASNNAGQSSQGQLASFYGYQAPSVNSVSPQALENGALPATAACQQLFSDVTGSDTVPLRGAGTTDAGNPPGNYVAAYPGAASPPHWIIFEGIQLNDAIGQISAAVKELDKRSASVPSSWGPVEVRPPAWHVFDPPLTDLTIVMRKLCEEIKKFKTHGGTEEQLLEAFNAGNAAAYPLASIGITRVSQEVYSMTCTVPAQPLFTVGSSGSSASGYTRYGMQFASGSTASSTDEVIVPGGTPGPSLSHAPTASWGPAYPNTLTDIVVNLDGQSAFNQFTTANGFSFPTVGALVEASRGNLESSAAAQGAGLDLNALGVTAQAGYQTAYQNAALLQLQPVQSVLSTLPAFLSLTTQMGQTNLGFSAFNDQAGTTPNQTFTASNVSPVYTAGGSGTFPLPGIQLAANNLSTIDAALLGQPALQVGGNRNTANVIKAALQQFTNGGRAGSQKAIVLITDGPPNEDLSGGTTNALSDARNQAALAKSQGVAIFCISIYSDATTQAAEQAIYNDTNRDPAAGGLSAIAGNGGRFYQVPYTNPSGTQTALTNAFGNVARQLVALMHQ